MRLFQPFSLNLKGRLIEFDRPAVMGILNVTPDSFYAGSRTLDHDKIYARAEKMINAGVDIIDIGGCSTRPGFTPVSVQEEWDRVAMGLKAVKEVNSDVIVSVDTYSADVARKSIETGADIINDVSAFTLDSGLRDVVIDAKIPYVLTHPSDTPLTPDKRGDEALQSVLYWFSCEIERLTQAGVADIIIDPGFGFGKTIDQNFDLMARLEAFTSLNRPVLVGISRKSMIYKTLNITPEESLNATTVLNTYALLNGASILRVHDVAEALQAVTLTDRLVATYAVTGNKSNS